MIINTPGLIANQTIEGPVEILAPEVTLDNCTIIGTNPAYTLVTANRLTRINNCRIIGSPHGQHRGVRTDAELITITNTKILNIWADIDAQAVGGWDGCKDLVVENCELEASGENVMFGGATLSSPDRQPQSIRIKNCVLSKNPLWRQKLKGETCKNLFEVKNGKYILFTQNRLINSWNDGGQDGYAILLTVRQDPSPWSSIEGIEISYNKITGVGAGIQMLGHDDYNTDPDNGYLQSILINGNEFEFDRAKAHSDGRQIMINSGGDIIHITNNKFKALSGSNSAIAFTNNKYKAYRMYVANNEFAPSDYGVVGDGLYGQTALDFFAPDCIWENNTGVTL